LPKIDDPRLKAITDASMKATSGSVSAFYGASADAPPFYLLLAFPTGGAPGIGDRGKAFDGADTDLRSLGIHVDRASTCDRTVDGVAYVCRTLREGSGVESGTISIWNNGRSGGAVYGVGFDQGSVIDTATQAEKLIEGRAAVTPHQRIINAQPARAIATPQQLGGLPMLDDPRLRAQSDAVAKDTSGAVLVFYGASADAPPFYELFALPTGGAPGIGDREKLFDGADANLRSLGIHVDRASTSDRTVDGVTYACAPLREGSGGDSGALCSWNNGRTGGSVYGVGVDQASVIDTATQAEKLIEGPAVAAPH
jgi:hypothetical protein